MTRDEKIKVVEKVVASKMKEYWNIQSSRCVCKEISTAIVDSLGIDKKQVADIISLKCKEIKADWWEKDAEVYANALTEDIITVKGSEK